MLERLKTVLQVIYLVFNEGYLSARADSTLRQDLSEEAIRLAELLNALLPEPQPEATPEAAAASVAAAIA